MEFNLLCFLLWSSKFIFLTQDLTMIKSYQGLWFFGHCKLCKFLKSKGEQEKVELQSLGDGGSFGRVSLQNRGNTRGALGAPGPPGCLLTGSTFPLLLWAGSGHIWALRFSAPEVAVTNRFHGARVSGPKGTFTVLSNPLSFWRLGRGGPWSHHTTSSGRNTVALKSTLMLTERKSQVSG